MIVFKSISLSFFLLFHSLFCFMKEKENVFTNTHCQIEEYTKKVVKKNNDTQQTYEIKKHDVYSLRYFSLSSFLSSRSI